MDYSECFQVKYDERKFNNLLIIPCNCRLVPFLLLITKKFITYITACFNINNDSEIKIHATRITDARRIWAYGNNRELVSKLSSELHSPSED